MKSRFRKTTLALAAVLVAAPTMALGEKPTPDPLDQLSNQVRHELVTLPFYNVFDNLTFRIDGGTVTLAGQVNRPTLKSDAEAVVRHVAGVREVKNEIEVLPLSGFDSRIRLSVLRAVYGSSVLNRYAMGAQPSIHIIVKDGNVTLEGVVSTQMDRNVAFLAANGVFGVFSVTNNLRVDRT
ncbi:MAG: BON domain-containing protein [Bryobacterales bacterium]|nr:BON domain-containing protein [Bryobacterales bacterium]